MTDRSRLDIAGLRDGVGVEVSSHPYNKNAGIFKFFLTHRSQSCKKSLKVGKDKTDQDALAAFESTLAESKCYKDFAQSLDTAESEDDGDTGEQIVFDGSRQIVSQESRRILSHRRSTPRSGSEICTASHDAADLPSDRTLVAWDMGVCALHVVAALCARLLFIPAIWGHVGRKNRCAGRAPRLGRQGRTCAGRVRLIEPRIS